MQRFTLPRDIYYGRGAMKAVRSLKGSRAVIVTGGNSMRKYGFLEKLENYLEDAGMMVITVDNVESDPSVETVRRGAKAMAAFNPQWIVAIGGGSAIDAAKVMWALYEHPEMTFEALRLPFNFPKLRRKARFAAIPSTSGTASEVTAFAVITDYSNGVKYPLADFEITPDIAIVDPDLTDSMPPEIAAYTGMDALTHAIEAYVSTMATPITDALAIKAVKTVIEHIEKAVGGNPLSREQMHYASTMAGMAFSNALLGITHSIAHKIGVAFSVGHLPHGCANAMLLPYVIEFNSKSKEAGAKYDEIAHTIGLADSDMLALRIRELNRRLKIPQTLYEFGVDRDEFESKVRNIASLAVEDACTSSNPRAVTAEGIETILRAVYGD